MQIKLQHCSGAFSLFQRFLVDQTQIIFAVPKINVTSQLTGNDTQIPKTFFTASVALTYIGHLSQMESSARTCSMLSSISLEVMSLGLIFFPEVFSGLRLMWQMCTDEVEADSFRLLIVWQNPFGVCRNCLNRLWTVFLGLVSALQFTVVLSSSPIE